MIWFRYATFYLLSPLPSEVLRLTRFDCFNSPYSLHLKVVVVQESSEIVSRACSPFYYMLSPFYPPASAKLRQVGLLNPLTEKVVNIKPGLGPIFFPLLWLFKARFCCPARATVIEFREYGPPAEGHASKTGLPSSFYSHHFFSFQQFLTREQVLTYSLPVVLQISSEKKSINFFLSYSDIEQKIQFSFRHRAE